MARRHLVLTASFATPILCVAAACSFPDVTFGPELREAPETGVDRNDVRPPSPEDAGAADADVPDTSVSVSVRDGGVVDAESCGARKPCDCDDDGYYAMGCDAGPDALPPNARLDDCDDLDPFRHPDQAFSDAGPSDDSGLWDWNCSGREEKAYVVPTCSGIVTGLGSCSGGPGPQADVACGQRVDRYACARVGLQCGLSQYVDQVIQICK